MKFFGMPFDELVIPFQSEVSTWVSPEEIQRWFDGESFLRAVRKKAAACLQRTRQKKRLLFQRCQKELQAMKEQFEESLEARLKEAEVEAVHAAVQWQLETQEQSEKLYETLMAQAHAALAEALDSIIPQLPWKELLAQEIERYLLNQPPNLFGTIKVSPSQLEALKEKFVAFPQLKWESDANLKEGEAELITDFFHASIDLEAQLLFLVEQLRAKGPHDVVVAQDEELHGFNLEEKGTPEEASMTQEGEEVVSEAEEGEEEESSEKGDSEEADLKESNDEGEAGAGLEGVDPEEAPEVPVAQGVQEASTEGSEEALPPHQWSSKGNLRSKWDPRIFHTSDLNWRHHCSHLLWENKAGMRLIPEESGIEPSASTKGEALTPLRGFEQELGPPPRKSSIFASSQPGVSLRF